MKQKFLLKAMLLLCALVVGSSSVWADNTVTWNINGVNTTASGGSDVNTTLKTSSVSPNTETGVWTAVASSSYAGSSTGAQLGSGSYTFAGTVSLSSSAIPSTATIKSVSITLSSSGTAYKIDATVGGAAFGSQQSVDQKASKTYTFTGEKVGNNIVLTFSNGGKKNVIITAISVTYANLIASDFTITTSNPLAIEMPAATTGTINYTTSSTGAITWESSDETVATVVDNEDGTATVTAHTAGLATISAIQAADANYKASAEKSITVNVTDTRSETVTEISAAGITNTDLKDGTDAGSFAASIMAGGSPVAGAAVTWSSSDPTIATINSTTGAVTLVKKGSTTITATYAGNASYASSSDTYELTVQDTRQELEVTATLNYTFFDLTPSGSATYVQPDETNRTITYKNIQFKTIKNDGTKVRYDADHLRLYNKNQMTITAPDGYAITDITLVGTSGDWANGMTADVGTYDDTKDADNKTYWTGLAESVTFSPAGTHRIASAIVTLAQIIPITPAKEYTTLTSAKNLDFTDVTGLEAYIATEVFGGSVKMTQVNKVPAGTGLVLMATTPGDAVNVPVFDGTGAEDVSANKMVGSATETTAVAEGAGYILSDGVFQPAKAGTLPAGKAYLNIAVSSAPFLSLDFGNEATNIADVRSKMEDVKGEVYNLNGQRVAQPTKGLYIVNGKKVVLH